MVITLAVVAVVFAVVGLVLAYFTGVFRGSITVQSDSRQRRRHTATGLVSAALLVLAGVSAAAAVGTQLNTLTGVILSIVAAVATGIVVAVILLFVSSRIAENSEDKARTKSLSWRGGRSEGRKGAGRQAGGSLVGPPGSPNGPATNLQPGFVYMTDAGGYVLALATSASHPSPAVVELPNFTVATPPTGPVVEAGPIEIQVLTEEQGPQAH